MLSAPLHSSSFCWSDSENEKKGGGGKKVLQKQEQLSTDNPVPSTWVCHRLPPTEKQLVAGAADERVLAYQKSCRTNLRRRSLRCGAQHNNSCRKRSRRMSLSLLGSMEC